MKKEGVSDADIETRVELAMLVHDDARSRMRAYIDVFRVLHREDPSLVAFSPREIAEVVTDLGTPVSPPVVRDWLEGDPAQPTAPASRREGRNADWPHVYNVDVLGRLTEKHLYTWNPVVNNWSQTAVT